MIHTLRIFIWSMQNYILQEELIVYTILLFEKDLFPLVPYYVPRILLGVKTDSADLRNTQGKNEKN